MQRRCFSLFRGIVLVSATLILLTTQAFAVTVPKSLFERFHLQEVMEALPNDAKNSALESALENMSMGKALQISPAQLLDLITENFRNSLAEYRQLILSLLGLAVIFWLVSQLCAGNAVTQITGVISCVFAVMLMSEPVIHAAGRTANTIESTCTFMLAFIPVYAAVLAASGAAATASVYHLIVLGGAQFISRLVGTSLVSLCGIYLTLCTAEGFAGDLLPKWSQVIKKGVHWVLVLAVTVFAGVLSLQSALTSAVDSAGVKTTKLLAGTFIPVIGNALGDAAQAAQGSIHIIRAALGSFGIIAAILALSPLLIELLLLRLGFGAAAILADTLSVGELASTIRSFGQLLSILTALVLTMALLVIVSTAVVLTAGGIS